MKLLRSFVAGLSSVAFPRVCVCCRTETTGKYRQICSFCREDRFVYANPDSELSGSGAILPDFVIIQHALWQFDRGGMLQDLMHCLKYEHLTGIGKELGRMLARSLANHPAASLMLRSECCVLVPVPLHYLKFRKRGFNQAYAIAYGVKEVTGLPICNIRAVIRQRNTRSQTGYSITRRISNMKGAFRVRNRGAFAGKVAIVIDDVFTTGATTFELSSCLHDAGCKGIIIATAAQA